MEPLGPVVGVVLSTKQKSVYGIIYSITRSTCSTVGTTRLILNFDYATRRWRLSNAKPGSLWGDETNKKKARPTHLGLVPTVLTAFPRGFLPEAIPMNKSMMPSRHTVHAACFNPNSSNDDD